MIYFYFIDLFLSTGEPGSDVHGAVILGIFRGTVQIPGDTVYHIEPAYRFFGMKAARKLPYHSVIYKEEHIDVNTLRYVLQKHGRYVFYEN